MKISIPIFIDVAIVCSKILKIISLSFVYLFFLDRLTFMSIPLRNYVGILSYLLTPIYGHVMNLLYFIMMFGPLIIFIVYIFCRRKRYMLTLFLLIIGGIGSCYLMVGIANLSLVHLEISNFVPSVKDWSSIYKLEEKYHVKIYAATTEDSLLLVFKSTGNDDENARIYENLNLYFKNAMK